MKKIITALLSTTLIFVMCFGFVSCKNKQALELTKYEITFSRVYGEYYKPLVLETKGMEFEEIQALDITAVSKDDNIVTVNGNKLNAKNVGTTEVIISYKGKEATVKVTVVKTVDYLKMKCDEMTYYKDQYNLCTWFLRELYKFKNPSSVQIIQVYGHENDQNEYNGFAIQVRAENSFGGMVIEDYYLTSYGISELGFEISSEPFYMMINGFGGSMITDYISTAIKEELNQY